VGEQDTNLTARMRTNGLCQLYFLCRGSSVEPSYAQLYKQCVPKANRFSRRTFGRAVRRCREKLGLSQEDFAEQAGIHRTYVSSIELGKVNVGIEVANQLAVALGIRLSELIRESE